jgi:hypothetical protein
MVHEESSLKRKETDGNYLDEPMKTLLTEQIRILKAENEDYKALMELHTGKPPNSKISSLKRD